MVCHGALEQGSLPRLRHPRPAADDGLVISFTRSLCHSLSQLAGFRSVALRRLALTLCVAIALPLLAATTPASARVVRVGTGLGSEVAVGLQSRVAESIFEAAPLPKSFNNPDGNQVVHKNETYAIYWDPTDHYHGDWQHLVDTFLQGLGADSGSTGTVFSVDSQYTDRSDLPASYLSTFRGAYTDTDPYPTGDCKDPHPLEVEDRIGPEVVKGSKKVHTEVCLTDAQLRKEMQTFIAAHGLQKGMSSIFYLLTPPGVAVCLDGGGPTGHCSDFEGTIAEIEEDEKEGTPLPESYKNSFCSYHSDFSNITLENTTTPEANTILYGVIPWTAGGLGDYHLAAADRTPAYECQDSGFYVNPQTGITEREKAKEAKIESQKEKEEHSKNAEEKKEQEEAQAKTAILEGPHQQEPNQLGSTRGPDGSFDTGLADLIVSQIGLQQQNIVTDPLLDAWQDSVGNEVTDECRNEFALYLGGSVAANEYTFAGTLYNQSFAGANAYINDAFNLAALRLPYPAIPCLPSIRLEPQFTAPNPVNTNELVSFDGMESDITLNDDVGFSQSTGEEETKYATYKWNFGDGTPEVTGFAPGAPSLNSPETSPCELPWKAPCAASTFHSYQYGGKYEVTLTVTDTGGNTASVTEPITVNGPSEPVPPPPPPPSPPPAPGSGSGATPSSSTTSTKTGTTTKTPGPPPVASAAAVPSSLVKTTRKGLTVRYSVNQQVAGRFEVLLAASIAHRIGLHPPLATGLPAGTPPQVVVGNAILITTRSGRGTIKIQFGKVTGARLRRLGKVSLMLRLSLRNSSGGTTSVLSKFTLR